MPFECCDKCGTKIAQLYAKVFRMKTYTLCGDCLAQVLALDYDEVVEYIEEGGKDAETKKA